MSTKVSQEEWIRSAQRIPKWHPTIRETGTTKMVLFFLRLGLGANRNTDGYFGKKNGKFLLRQETPFLAKNHQQNEYNIENIKRQFNKTTFPGNSDI